jgi:mannosyltransferase OCH1-like enzyme
MIEKNIFQTWYTRDLHPSVAEITNQIKRLNPEYIYHLYTDVDMDNFVNEHFKGEIADCYNRLNMIVAKADLWRYLVIYKYGGVYLDMDSNIKRPLRELISDEDEGVITAEGNPNLYVQWGLMYSKKHPILKRTIEIVIDNIKNNRHPNSVLHMTGPYPYSKALNEIHRESYGTDLVHSTINQSTDIRYKTRDNHSYRIYGIDYNDFCEFKHSANHFLYINRPNWQVVDKYSSVLKPLPNKNTAYNSYSFTLNV